MSKPKLFGGRYPKGHSIERFYLSWRAGVAGSGCDKAESREMIVFAPIAAVTAPIILPMDAPVTSASITQPVKVVCASTKAKRPAKVQAFPRIMRRDQKTKSVASINSMSVFNSVTASGPFAEMIVCAPFWMIDRSVMLSTPT